MQFIKGILKIQRKLRDPVYTEKVWRAVTGVCKTPSGFPGTLRKFVFLRLVQIISLYFLAQLTKKHQYKKQQFLTQMAMCIIYKTITDKYIFSPK